MAGYPYVSQVQDPNAQKALRNAFDLIAALTARVEALEASAVSRGTTGIDAGGLPLQNLADPTGEQDAVTVTFLRAYVAAQGAF